MDRMERCVTGVMLLAAVSAVVTAGTRPAPGKVGDDGVKTEVKIDNFSFAPGEITVAKGTTVNWINRDDIPHTVVSDDKTTFKSKPLDTDDKFSYTFSKEGNYTYFCSIHPKMTAKDIVK